MGDDFGAFLQLELPEFEGPLDLLLHLIQKHELDIFDIPVAFVTERYLEYIAMMQALDLDIAAEYLLMAATLAHIKSKMLLPNEPADDASADGEADGEVEDPRAELVRRLLEYQKFRAAAEDLAARGVAGRDVFPRGMPVAVETDAVAPLAELPVFSLLDAFKKLLERRKLNIAHEVTTERVSIAERINEIVGSLRERRSARFDELFEGVHSTLDVVVTFLALLEMTRLRMTRLYQTDAFEPLHITLVLVDVEPGDGLVRDDWR
ncbi:MAG: segregation/condensation protein A [Myxococcales bacterium]|nr:segregation/condensation protein A [Myxococcales bacterium]